MDNDPAKRKETGPLLTLMQDTEPQNQVPVAKRGKSQIPNDHVSTPAVKIAVRPEEHDPAEAKVNNTSADPPCLQPTSYKPLAASTRRVLDQATHLHKMSKHGLTPTSSAVRVSVLLLPSIKTPVLLTRNRDLGALSSKKMACKKRSEMKPSLEARSSSCRPRTRYKSSHYVNRDHSSERYRWGHLGPTLSLFPPAIHTPTWQHDADRPANLPNAPKQPDGQAPLAERAKNLSDHVERLQRVNITASSWFARLVPHISLA
ncbi:hypothetical protein ACJZ2D_010297 [Fusarium nematophilum]